MTIKKASIILVVLSVIVIIIMAILIPKKNTDEYTLAQVTKGNIHQTVSETGTIKAVKELDLNFPVQGKLNKIFVKIGDVVKKNTVLAELDYVDLEIRKNEAKANVDVANGNLNKLLAGATKEEIAISEANQDQAKTAYEAAKSEFKKTDEATLLNVTQAKKNLNDIESETDFDVTTYEQAITSAIDALENTKTLYRKEIDDKKAVALTIIEEQLSIANTALDVIYQTITDEDSKDYISKKAPSYLDATKSYYNEALSQFETAEKNLLLVKTQNEQNIIQDSLNETIEVLRLIFSSLLNCYNALENSVTNSTFTETTLSIYKTNITAQQTLIAAGQKSTETALENLNDAILNYNTKVNASENTLLEARTALNNAKINYKNAYETAQTTREQQLAVAQSRIDSTYKAWQVTIAQLNQVKAPANTHDVTLAQAKLRQAQASFDTIMNQIDNSIIKAPEDGVITDITGEVGEQVSPSKTLIVLLSDKQFEIEVLVSEADIAKLKIENDVKITLDAYGDDVKFQGKVIFIEPAETVIQDVIYYKTIINFESGEYSIKSGMTANVIVTTAKKDNVLFVPSRAVIQKNGFGKFARVLENGQVVEKKVEVGLRGDDGVYEVIFGLKEGETVVTYIKSSK